MDGCCIDVKVMLVVHVPIVIDRPSLLPSSCNTVFMPSSCTGTGVFLTVHERRHKGLQDVYCK
jgi:hypothetical protein